MNYFRSFIANKCEVWSVFWEVRTFLLLLDTILAEKKQKSLEVTVAIQICFKNESCPKFSLKRKPPNICIENKSRPTLSFRRSRNPTLVAHASCSRHLLKFVEIPTE